MKWLQEEELDEKSSRKLLDQTNRHLIIFFVKPLITHFYEPVRSTRSYAVTFVPKSTWHSFQDNVLKDLINDGCLKEDTAEKKCRGVLKIVPKTSCETLEYRTYVICPKKFKKGEQKLISHRQIYFKKINSIINGIVDELRVEKLDMKDKKCLFTAWKNYTDNKKSEPIYGIKLDIKDAFGHINILLLGEIIDKYNNFFSPEDRNFILNRIKNQYVKFRGKIYKFERGILQGDPLSSSLCNLYIAHLESLKLKKFVKPEHFFHRVVDDYLFCSTRLENVREFENEFEKLFPLNNAKTERVFLNNNDYKLTYCGQIFNLSTKEVSKFYDIKSKNINIRNKFKLWNSNIPIVSKTKFILTSLKFSSNNFYFKPMELNTHFNTESKVLYNYFEGMSFLAYKFDVVIKSIVNFRETANSISNLYKTIKAIIYVYAKKCMTNIDKFGGKHNTGYISIQLLWKIGCKAFVLVLKRRNEFYKELLQHFNKEKLFLNLKGLTAKPSLFSRIPEPLQNLTINRKSKI